MRILQVLIIAQFKILQNHSRIMQTQKISTLHSSTYSSKVISQKYDKIFNISFPYSAGIHQAPTDGNPHPEWHFHMNLYPPLLRSETIKKHMVGYEMLCNPQRDITAEYAAEILKKL